MGSTAAVQCLLVPHAGVWCMRSGFPGISLGWAMQHETNHVVFLPTHDPANMVMLCLPGMAAAWLTALEGLDDELKDQVLAHFIRVRGALARQHLQPS